MSQVNMRNTNSFPAKLLTVWSAEIGSFLERDHSAMVGLFDLAGHMLWANAGLADLLDVGESWEPAGLIDPLPGDLPPASDGAPLYRGLLQLNAGEAARTLQGEIWQRGDEFLMLAEPPHSHLSDLQERARFAHAAAHDLRGLIGNIHVAAHYMLDEADRLEEADVALLSVIVEQSEKALALVEDILQLAQIEADQVALSLDVLDARHCIGEVVEVQREAAGRRGVRIETTVEGDALVRADTLRLQQAVGYLIENAAARSPEGGTVRVGCRPDGHALHVTVTDAGPSLSPEQQARLFDVFDESARKLAHSGPKSGLEMAIARLIVEAHGGQIGVTSGAGEGAIFWFTLPCRE